MPPAKKTTAKPKMPKAAKTPKAASAGAKPAFGSPAWRAKYMKSGGK